MQVLTTSPTTAYTGIGQALARISSVEGFRGLWKGIASVILGAGPAHALYFGTYELVKDFSGGNKEGFQFLSTSMAGASATIVADAFMNPFDVIKQRMQMEGNPYTSIAQCARSMYRSEGLRAFYVSYPITLASSVPFTAVQFATYEWAKGLLNPKDTYSPLTHAVAGGLAGATAAFLTNPLDVCKTLLQTRGCSSVPEVRAATTITQAFRVIYAREGLRGFARGVKPRIFTHMPSNALCWLSYEGFRFAIHEFDG
ncbi:Fe(2+) transporter [Malassezia equina]|uniref:Fe(2+) transporter n=1 Tax=Malassezia equina TaxID=1381935 RepID=A0AAF0EHP1_9BASI|nr:Fe(2+) transporter [Malassezia equina]